MLVYYHAELRVDFVDGLDLLAALDFRAKIAVRNLDEVHKLAFQVVVLMLEAAPPNNPTIHQVTLGSGVLSSK